MGLAASQARFLNLVARKTNIEYEGQQINQQRTTLANQSANYYNSMLTLSVPTPPSTESYQTVVYSVTYGSQVFNISQVTNSSTTKGAYNIAYTTSYDEDKVVSYNNYPITKDASGKYYYGGKEILLAQATSASKETPFTQAVIDQTKKEINAAKDRDVKTSFDMYYMNVGTEKAPKYVYFDKADLEKANTSTTDKTAMGYSQQNITTYKSGVWENATIVRDANNRISAISTSDLANGELMSVTSKTVTDDAAYDDAYNEYTYQTYLYEQELENINAQTSVIQAQDKKLELRLKQLDTEQSAISTEMESISSVIDKNVDDSFKTFA